MTSMRLLLVLCLAGLIPSLVKAQQPAFRIDSLTTLISLDSLWRYYPGDDTLFAQPEFDDSSWDILSPRLNLTGIPDSVFTGYGWFRLHLQIDSSLRNKPFALRLNQQGASEIYFDGAFMYSAGNFSKEADKEETTNPRELPFILSFSDSLDYLLAIRYSNLEAHTNLKRYKHAQAGFIAEVLSPKQAMSSIKSTLPAVYLIFFLFCVFFILSFVHFLLYLFYRRQRSNLYYSIFMFLFSAIVFNTFLSNGITESPEFQTRFSFFISILFPFFFLPLMGFVYTLFLKKIPRIFWFTLGAGVIISILYYLDVSFIMVLYIGFVLLLWFEITRVIILAIIRKFDGAWIIGTGVLFFILFFTVIIVLVILFGSFNVDGSNPYAAVIALTLLAAILSIPLSMSIYLARDFAQTNRNLQRQLEQVKVLSAKTLEQEREKKRILEGQKEKLEIQVKERTKELAAEKEKTEELLLNTLPLKVVNDLKQNGKTEPESFEDVTVYFSDIVGFTNISSRLEPKMLIEELNEIFTGFDDIMEKHGCERIKTIGDAYLAVCGMPEKQEEHAQQMLQAAMEIKNYLVQRNESSEIQWKVRIGIHSGKVVGGIVGVKKYIYDVFGDTINTTSRMESNSEPMRINVSEATYELAKDKFAFIEREPMEIKGKGRMKMYFLEEG